MRNKIKRQKEVNSSFCLFYNFSLSSVLIFYSEPFVISFSQMNDKSLMIFGSSGKDPRGNDCSKRCNQYQSKTTNQGMKDFS